MTPSSLEYGIRILLRAVSSFSSLCICLSTGLLTAINDCLWHTGATQALEKSSFMQWRLSQQTPPAQLYLHIFPINCFYVGDTHTDTLPPANVNKSRSTRHKASAVVLALRLLLRLLLRPLSNRPLAALPQPCTQNENKKKKTRKKIKQRYRLINAFN